MLRGAGLGTGYVDTIVDLSVDSHGGLTAGALVVGRAARGRPLVRFAPPRGLPRPPA